MLSGAEITQALENIRFSWACEGQHMTPEDQKRVTAVLRGDITGDAAVTAILQKHGLKKR